MSSNAIVFNDIPATVTLCKTDPAFQHFVGTTFIRAFFSQQPGDLSKYILLITSYPPLAAYVQGLSLSKDLDSKNKSGVLEMLQAVYEADIDAIGPSDEDNNDEYEDEQDISDTSDLLSEISETPSEELAADLARILIYNNDAFPSDNMSAPVPAPITLKSVSPVLKSLAQDVYLVTMGDITDVPDEMYFNILRVLFQSVIGNVRYAVLPKEWEHWFNVAGIREIWPLLMGGGFQE